jgi:phage gp16-like protein
MAQDPYRNALMGVIHTLAKKAGLDDDTYRAMLLQHGGEDSCRKMGKAALERVCAHLRSVTGAPVPTEHPGRPTNMQERPQLTKIEALLADQGLPWSYANAIAKRMFGIDRVQLCEGEQLAAIIAALHVRQKKQEAANEPAST